MKKSFMALIGLMFCLVLLAVPLSAATLELNDATVEAIMAGIGGLTVIALTQLVKNWLKVEGLLAVGVSILVSAAATAFYLIKTASFDWLSFVGYTILVAAIANGWYKKTKTS